MWWYNHYHTINKLKGKFTSKAYPSRSIMISCVLVRIPFLTAPPYRSLFYNDHCSFPESGQVLQYQVLESLQRLAIWDQSLIGPIDPRSIMTLILPVLLDITAKCYFGIAGLSISTYSMTLIGFLQFYVRWNNSSQYGNHHWKMSIFCSLLFWICNDHFTGIYNGRITALLIQLRLCSPILKYHLVGNNGFNNKSLRIIWK